MQARKTVTAKGFLLLLSHSSCQKRVNGFEIKFDCHVQKENLIFLVCIEKQMDDFLR